MRSISLLLTKPASSVAAALLRAVFGATFTLVGGLLRPRTLHTATMLPNGKVLFVGGGVGTTTPSTAELYRPGH